MRDSRTRHRHQTCHPSLPLSNAHTHAIHPSRRAARATGHMLRSGTPQTGHGGPNAHSMHRHRATMRFDGFYIHRLLVDWLCSAQSTSLEASCFQAWRSCSLAELLRSLSLRLQWSTRGVGEVSAELSWGLDGRKRARGSVLERL